MNPVEALCSAPEPAASLNEIRDMLGELSLKKCHELAWDLQCMLSSDRFRSSVIDMSNWSRLCGLLQSAHSNYRLKNTPNPIQQKIKCVFEEVKDSEPCEAGLTLEQAIQAEDALPPEGADIEEGHPDAGAEQELQEHGPDEPLF
jgi:hypothetical protein